MKLCRNCKHCLIGGFSSAQCDRSTWIHPVTGDTRLADAFTERMDSNKCGPDAKYFEPFDDENSIAA